jgi:lysylphosphatidylglycerol synthetase-like protein (DUF2156 family)
MSGSPVCVDWAARYVAYPGGLHRPRIFTDAAALGAGGYRRIVLK